MNGDVDHALECGLMWPQLLNVGIGAIIGLAGTVIVTIINRSDRRNERSQQLSMHEEILQNTRLMQQDTFANVWRERYWERREAMYLEYLRYASEVFQFLRTAGREDGRSENDAQIEELLALIRNAEPDGRLRISILAYGSNEFYKRVEMFDEAVPLYVASMGAFGANLNEEERKLLVKEMEYVLQASYVQVIAQTRRELAEGHQYQETDSLLDASEDADVDADINADSQEELRQAITKLGSLIVAAAKD